MARALPAKHRRLDGEHAGEHAVMTERVCAPAPLLILDFE
jgi:hypothetical protein